MEPVSGAAEAAGSGASQLPTSALPWHQIPKFEPGTTDLRSYAKKLEFLRDLWPSEHIETLGSPCSTHGGRSGLPKGGSSQCIEATLPRRSPVPC